MKRASSSGPRPAAAKNAAPQTVYIVDDDGAVRESLYWLISAAGFNAQAFGSADEFLAALGPNPSGCALIDVRMPGMSGLRLQELLKERGGSMAVIIVTGHADVAMAVRAMKAGATDLVEKPFNDQVVLDLVSETLRKNVVAERRLARQLEIDQRYQSLSKREGQVFERLAAGQSNKVIAADLGLSQKTIEIHRSKVMRKMKAKSFAELVGMAGHLRLARDGFIALSDRDRQAGRRSA